MATNNNKRTKYGNAVRAARTKRGWTQTELASLVGCHTNSIRNVELSGRCSKPIAGQLAEHLKVKPIHVA